MRDVRELNHGIGKRIPRILCLTALFVVAELSGSQVSRGATTWQPDPVKYGYGVQKDIPVRMDDGVVLRADVYFPTDPATEKRAPGSFPVLLQQTPYGKSKVFVYLQDRVRYFVSRGYLLAVADLRGYGNSQGQAAWFGTRMGRDGAELAEWAAHLDGADGRVGLMGCSYLGAVQFFTANSLSPHSPVKAIAPFCVDSDFYRDLIAMGGIPTQFVVVDRAMTARGVNDDPATDPLTQTIISEETGRIAYYGEYWKSLNVTTFMPRIVSLGIPMLTESGWRDLFPGGNIDAYVAAQNAFDHRPVGAPLLPGEPVSGRYQAIVGPWIHGEHVGDTLQPVLLEWFDTWLKGERTGMADTRAPLHLFVRGAQQWIDTASWPVTREARSFDLWPGLLADAGAMGNCAVAAADSAGCSQRLMWAPEGRGTVLTFDSPTLTRTVTIAGPGDVTVYLKSTRPDVELAATLFDVSPDGKAVKVTNGAQLGSQRALNEAASWYSVNGLLIRPSHYFTEAKSSPVPVGTKTRVDIELLPAAMQILVGHKLRLQLATEPADDFHQYSPRVQMRNPLTPTPTELMNLTGGIYKILYGAQGQSVMNLSIATDSDLAVSHTNWGPAQ